MTHTYTFICFMKNNIAVGEGSSFQSMALSHWLSIWKNVFWILPDSTQKQVQIHFSSKCESEMIKCFEKKKKTERRYFPDLGS